MDAGTLTEEQVKEAYRSILCRRADANGLASYVGRPMSIEELELALKTSNEYSNRVDPFTGKIKLGGKPRKVLLFGAYGNGNLGDALQAISLRNTIAEITSSVECWATTVLDSDYPFSTKHKLPREAIRNLDTLSQFDALVIGGGGLLSHPHAPLTDAKWVNSLPIPFAFLSVGANEPCAFQSYTAISGAAWVSGRDVESIKTLLKYRSSVQFTPDPILIENNLHEAAQAQAFDTCWILRGPLDENHHFIKAVFQPKDLVVGIEPEADSELKSLFPNIVLLSDCYKLLDLISSSKRVVSMRYHGVIFSLRLGVPIFSLRLPKGTALLNSLGLAENAFSRAQDLMFAKNNYDAQCFQMQRLFYYQVFKAGLLSMFATLGKNN